MCLEQVVDDLVERARIQFGESAPERVEAVSEGAAAKGRTVDPHRAVGHHGVQLTVIEHGIEQRRAP